ncbi:MAG: hypothetical protein ABI212_04680 [Burkholderiaceae bacterium]
MAKAAARAAAKKAPCSASTASPSTRSASAAPTGSATGPTSIVGYEGNTAADRALEFSASRARDRNGQVHVAYVLE